MLAVIVEFLFNRVMIFVRDAQACAAFYRDHFGLKPAGAWSVEWAELEGNGGLRLAFHQAYVNGRPVAHPTGSAQHPHKLVFRVADVVAARAALVAQGVTMDEVREFPEAGGLVICDGTDIEGHRFQLCNR